MKQVYSEKENCCGCTACASICPTKAIQMTPDFCGFLYPQIDMNKCIDCGLCKKVCMFNCANTAPLFKKCYIVKHKSSDVVKESRSGGVFTALSDYIISQNGVIYGACLDENLFVRHGRAVSSEERDSFRKSKYVQSNLDGIFSLVRDDLNNGRTVMFTGCPCQCDGLKGYLEKNHVNTENLLMCDIICHSNASPGLFKRYLAYLQDKHKCSISEFEFRDKEFHHWNEHVEKVIFDNGRVFFTDEYTNLFYNYSIRPSCFKCSYTSLHRKSDITIADCWGGNTVYPDLADKTGASLVLINTEKGANYLNCVDSDIIVRELNIEDVMQPRMQTPATVPSDYNAFWVDYAARPFSQIIKKYSRNNYSSINLMKKKAKRIATIPYRAVRKIVRMMSR